MSDHDDKTNNQNEKLRKTFETIKASQLPPDWASRGPREPTNVWDQIEYRLKWRRAF